MKNLFGTDGIRCKANEFPLTPEFVFKIGQSIGWCLTKGKTGVIAIGKDTRISCDMLECALSAGINSAGVNVLPLGIIPTPAIAYLTKIYNANAGIVISASHNSFEDNGIKIFNSAGFKLSDEQEEEIENNIGEVKFTPPPFAIGRVIPHHKDKDDYIKYLISTIPSTYDFSQFKIVIDSSNGALFNIAPRLFKKLKAQIKNYHILPDGININKNCGSLHPENISRKVTRLKADIGFCFDGDGDRVIAIDENGDIVDGDRIMAIWATHLKSKGKLKNNILVSTIMSNLGLEKYIKDLGVEFIRANVGDRYVLEEMKKRNAILGGEQSGHIINLEHQTTGDGLLTALHLACIMKETGEKLSKLKDKFENYPQILLNVPIKERKDFSTIPGVKEAIEAVEKELNNKGRLSVRYSGTELLARVMIEGQNQDHINQLAQKIASAFKNNLG
ncbi:MAG: phosphoglucosamine mutase [bacterium]|nr:phosphoglucosamine mutase [bacterium]